MTKTCPVGTTWYSVVAVLDHHS